jgi:hypothetical protein
MKRIKSRARVLRMAKDLRFIFVSLLSEGLTYPGSIAAGETNHLYLLLSAVKVILR